MGFHEHLGKMKTMSLIKIICGEGVKRGKRAKGWDISIFRSTGEEEKPANETAKERAIG